MNSLEKLNNAHKENLKLYAAEHDDPFVIRKSQAILLLEHQASEETIELLTGYKRDTAVKFRKLFMRKGLDALVCKRKKKTPRALLTRNQMQEIIKVLHTQTPEDYGYTDVKFWTTNILGHLIFEQYNVKYKSRTSIYLIFKQAKFTYHKPEKNYEKHDEKVVAEWKEKMQPIIQECWNDKNIVILTGDEMILSSETTTQKVWLPVNEQPKILVNKKRELCHIYGFLNIKTGFDHAFKTQNQTGNTTVSVLKKDFCFI